MAKKEIRRPDEAALRRVLENCKGKSAELILRLAWTAGLTAVEMHALRWADVAFSDKELRLADRSVPMDEGLQRCLAERYRDADLWEEEFVVTTDRRHAHMHRVYISKEAGAALGQEPALAEITLKDLREDFVIRMLEQYDWPYAARISGTSISTLNANYAQYRKREAPAGKAKDVDEFALWKVLQAEETSPEGLALWMTRELGLSLKEAAALTWQQVDMEAKTLCLPGRTVPMGARLERLLRQLLKTRGPEDDLHVLLTPRARGPFDARRLGIVVRQTLIKGGIDEVTAGELIAGSQQQRQETPALQMIDRKGSATRDEVAELLGVSPQQAWRMLNRLTEEGKLVRVGWKYFKAGSVVPPEAHARVICEHLKKRPAAGRQELAALLNVDLRQCGWILNCLVADGTLVREGKKYRLP